MRNKVTLPAQLPLAGGFAALALLLFAPETVHAQTDVLFACYVPNSGVMYRVNPPGSPGQTADLKDDCTGQKHVKFSWGGAEGLSGYERVTQEFTVLSTPAIQSFTVGCPAGKKVVGGGHLYGISPFVPQPQITTSIADSDSEWLVRVLTPGTSFGIRITAVCITASL